MITEVAYSGIRITFLHGKLRMLNERELPNETLREEYSQRRYDGCSGLLVLDTLRLYRERCDTLDPLDEYRTLYRIVYHEGPMYYDTPIFDKAGNSRFRDVRWKIDEYVNAPSWDLSRRLERALAGQSLAVYGKIRKFKGSNVLQYTVRPGPEGLIMVGKEE